MLRRMLGLMSILTIKGINRNPVQGIDGGLWVHRMEGEA